VWPKLTGILSHFMGSKYSSFDPKEMSVINSRISRPNSGQLWTTQHRPNTMLPNVLSPSNITLSCNVLYVAPVFAFSAGCTSPCASSLLACLNSIRQSRKSFRTSPCFSLKTTVTDIKIIRNVCAGLHPSDKSFRNSKMYQFSSKIKPYIYRRTYFSHLYSTVLHTICLR